MQHFVKNSTVSCYKHINNHIWYVLLDMSYPTGDMRNYPNGEMGESLNGEIWKFPRWENEEFANIFPYYENFP